MVQLLKDRSMLYCICRKPYDQRAMIACDKCDEWYHFGCVKLRSAPKVYICPACEPLAETLSTPALVDCERSVSMSPSSYFDLLYVLLVTGFPTTLL